MTTYQKGKLLNEGKTKKVWEVAGDSNLVIIENKADITAFDDPKFTKQFQTKAIYATETTCRVFELLKKAAVPVAYIEQISPTEFVTPKCSMIALEVVGRRYAVGSYLKRNPNLEQPKDKPPIRFHRLVIEFFLKTTKGKLTGDNGKIIVEGLDPQKGEEDPLIQNPYEEKWTLVHPKKPSWDASAKLREGILAADVIGKTQMKNMDDCLRNVFLVLEGMWSFLGHRFIDIKIEFGMTDSGELLVADVIDNDSWRLRDANWEELSKEAFRQGEALDEVERKYGIVAELVKGFRIPKQCLVLWRGSDKDKFPEIPKGLNLEKCVDLNETTASGHKSPRKVLNALEELLGAYPDGGAIIAKVGMSNGLGPILAARTVWPVISIPATLDKNPEDVWSSLRLPSSVPMATICSEGNAINFALNVLAQKNPLLYQQVQRKVEELDE